MELIDGCIHPRFCSLFFLLANTSTVRKLISSEFGFLLSFHMSHVLAVYPLISVTVPFPEPVLSHSGFLQLGKGRSTSAHPGPYVIVWRFVTCSRVSQHCSGREHQDTFRAEIHPHGMVLPPLASLWGWCSVLCLLSSKHDIWHLQEGVQSSMWLDSSRKNPGWSSSSGWWKLPCLLGPSKQQTFSGHFPQTCASIQSCLRGQRSTFSHIFIIGCGKF